MKRDDSKSPPGWHNRLFAAMLSLSLAIGICVPTFAFGLDSETLSEDNEPMTSTSSEDPVETVQAPADAIDTEEDITEADSGETSAPEADDTSAENVQVETPSLNIVCAVGDSEEAHEGDITGSCGENVKYCLHPNGDGFYILTISGTGPMSDYMIGKNNRAPWYGYKVVTAVVEEGVTTLGNLAFYNCTLLTSVSLPNTIERFGLGPFTQCRALSSIVIPDSVTDLGFGSFCNCSSLSSVNIPNSVTELSQEVFENCALTSIVIPDSVKTIGKYAFGGCPLTAVDIPDSVETLNEGVFKNCKSLTSINIPESITEISSGLFWGCSSLASFVIPDQITSIGESAFRECTSLAGMVVPENVTSIGINTFYNCSTLSSLVFECSNCDVHSSAFSSCGALTEALFPSDSSESEGFAAMKNKLSSSVISYYDAKVRDRYTSFEEAVALASESGADIKLYCDVASSDVIAAGNIKIDLNNHTLTINGGEYLGLEAEGGTVVINAGIFAEMPNAEWIADHTKINTSDDKYLVRHMNVSDLMSCMMTHEIDMDVSADMADVIRELIGMFEALNDVPDELFMSEVDSPEELNAMGFSVVEATPGCITDALANYHNICVRIEVKHEDRENAPDNELALIDDLEDRGQAAQYFEIHAAIIDKDNEDSLLGYVAELPRAITVNIDVPEEYRANGSTFYMIRTHEGIAERIDGEYNEETNVFTFTTDKFCTFALSYDPPSKARSIDYAADNDATDPADTSGSGMPDSYTGSGSNAGNNGGTNSGAGGSAGSGSSNNGTVNSGGSNDSGNSTSSTRSSSSSTASSSNANNGKWSAVRSSASSSTGSNANGGTWSATSTNITNSSNAAGGNTAGGNNTNGNATNSGNAGSNTTSSPNSASNASIGNATSGASELSNAVHSTASAETSSNPTSTEVAQTAQGASSSTPETANATEKAPIDAASQTSESEATVNRSDKLPEKSVYSASKTSEAAQDGETGNGFMLPVVAVGALVLALVLVLVARHFRKES